MVHVETVFTIDPSNPWYAKAAFFPNDPFGIMTVISASPEVVAEGLRYDLCVSLVNPRNDPYEPSWYADLSGEGVKFDTVDYWSRNNVFKWEGTGHMFTWAHYSDAVTHVLGGEKLRGVFAVRASIDVLGSDLFDLTEPFAFKYKVRAN